MHDMLESQFLDFVKILDAAWYANTTISNERSKEIKEMDKRIVCVYTLMVMRYLLITDVYITVFFMIKTGEQRPPVFWDYGFLHCFPLLDCYQKVQGKYAYIIDRETIFVENMHRKTTNSSISNCEI